MICNKYTMNCYYAHRKKLRYCAWDLNPGPQDWRHRRIHWIWFLLPMLWPPKFHRFKAFELVLVLSIKFPDGLPCFASVALLCKTYLGSDRCTSFPVSELFKHQTSCEGWFSIKKSNYHEKKNSGVNSIRNTQISH